MNQAFSLGDGDRLLILAPHPDDESIATGGLIQVALASGVATRVVVLTDGDNNPWPQRWIEKRWRIGAAERARWGTRRRGEAREAMRILGMADDQMRFLGLPDMGLTDLLMCGQSQPIELLRDAFVDFAPTVVVLPALVDRHPDHSATNILARMALAGSSLAEPALYGFAVHGQATAADDVEVSLSPGQVEVKRRAILAHASQMRLSSRRFLRYAQAGEYYRHQPPNTEPDPRHPLQARFDRTAGLRVRVDRQRWGKPLRNDGLFVAGGNVTGPRLFVPLTGQAGQVQVRDTRSDRTPVNAVVQQSEQRLEILIPATLLGSGDDVYVKLARPEPGLWVLDRFGWQPVSCDAYPVNRGGKSGRGDRI